MECLSALLGAGIQPEALMISSLERATHADVLREMSGLGSDRVLVGKQFREPASVGLLRSLDLDYILGVHFPQIIPETVNLLPHNRGWHTPSWAILDETPIGATLHFMDSGVDAGDIVAQAELEIRPEDTAHTLWPFARP